VYSDRDDALVPSGRWVKVPDSHFFGKKFEFIIKNSARDILLIITADAKYHDWLKLVRDCQLAFEEHPDLGVWSPSVDYSNWTIESYSLGAIKQTTLHRVFQTDSIVWSLSRR